MLKNHYFIFNKTYPKSLVLILLGSLVAAILEMLSLGSLPLFVGFISAPTTFIENIPFENLKIELLKLDKLEGVFYFTSLILALFVGKNLFLGLLIYFENKIFYKIKEKISSALYNYYIFSPYEFHLNENPAELSRNIITETDNVVNNLMQIIKLKREILIILVIFLLLVFSDPIITLFLSLVLFTSIGLFHFKIRKSLKKWSEQNISIRKSLIQYVYEAFGSIKDIKIYLKEKIFEKKFKESMKKSTNNSFYYQLVLSAPKIFLEVLAILILLGITTYFLLLDKDFYSFLPILTLIVVSIVRLTPSASQIANGISVIKHNYPSVKTIINELSQYEKNTSENTEEIKNIDKNENFEKLEVKNIFYKYPKVETNTLENISFKVKKNEIIGITGKTGSGKTTLFQNLLTLLKPQSGTIQFNDKNIFKNLKEWRSKIGYVSQEIYLLDDTILKNITFFNDLSSINQDKLKNILKLSELENFINTLPEGINTNVGPNGIRLSGGQKQRIGIARALYKETEILFFDEATSALDFKTEEEILKSIKSLKGLKTMFIIAHRLSTIKNCDQVFILDKGKLIDSGDFKNMNEKYKLENE